MITQTLKRWLNNLFAWWPWKHSTFVEQTPSVSSMNRGLMQDSLWYVPVDDSTPHIPQLDYSPVAVEQNMGDLYEDVPLPDNTYEAIDQFDDAELNIDTDTETIISPPPSSISEEATPIDEHHLGFLRYLVQQGIVNEGFTEEQRPEQYR